MKLNMCRYLRTKCHVSSTILTKFRQEGGILPNPLPPPTVKRTPKRPTQIRVGYFNGTLILIFFVPSFPFLPASFVLNLNEVQLLSSAGKSRPLSSKIGSSL